MDTRPLVLSTYHLYPTMEACAKAVGVSRERVRQILRSEGIAWRIGEAGPCRTHFCQDCGGPARNNRRCHTCYVKVSHVTLTCAACGETFTRRAPDYRAALKRRRERNIVGLGWFCTHSCYRSLGWKLVRRATREATTAHL